MMEIWNRFVGVVQAGLCIELWVPLGNSSLEESLMNTNSIL
jgi:hypothetical protein